MAQYNAYKSYNIEQFEPRAVTNSNAAPKMKPAPQKRPQLEILKKPRMTAKAFLEESQTGAKQARKIFIISALVLAFMFVVIYSRVQLDEINREISSIEKSITLAQSDTIKLDNQLSSMVSINKVEEYAANVLGMVKVQDYQVVYVDLSADDSVVVANGKQAQKTDVINETDK